MLEVDGSVLRARGRWVMCLRSMVACFESGMRRRHALRPGSRRWCALRLGTRQWCAPGLGLRMAGGGGATVFRVTDEREHLAVSKNC
jgi:hypothetical protein